MDRWRRQSQSPSPQRLSLIKAAVRAWNQQGYGRHKFSTTHKAELTTRARSSAPRPTRYKLEFESETRLSSSSSSLLLDLYEIERITRELNDLIGSGKKGPICGPTKRVDDSKKFGGFWVRHAVGICVSREHMEEEAVLCGRRRGKPRAVA